jgi:hypothetical protein
MQGGDMLKQKCLAVMLIVALAASASAQQYILSAPGVEFSSKAYLTEAKLDVIDARGDVNSYLRDTSYDTPDGKWKGFRNNQIGRVLLWPSDNRGNLQIGTQKAGTIQFTTSRMQIRPGAPQPGDPANPPDLPLRPDSRPNSLDAIGSPQETFPEYQSQDWTSFATSDFFSQTIHNPINRLPTAQPIHLVSYDANGRPWALTQRGARLGLTPRVSSQALWWLAPAGPGIVRMQMQSDGQVWAITADERNALRLSLISQDPRQLWRVLAGAQPNHYLLENAFYVGNYLTQLDAGNLGMQPMLGLPTQHWVPLMPPQNQLALLQPFWRNVTRDLRPNPPLPPAEIELTNSSRYALIVLVGDLRSGQVVKEVRVEPAGSTAITVERDAGSTIFETVEILTAGGSWSRQTYTTPIPPVSLYDLSVYEEFLQSIAIDRTGKSPNPIEDINYVPKSTGMIILPPGDALPQRGQMDVFSQAQGAKNPGAVRRMDMKRFEKPKADPLGSILEEIQRKQPPNPPRSF